VAVAISESAAADTMTNVDFMTVDFMTPLLVRRCRARLKRAAAAAPLVFN
jgi:hypothetical protein